METKVCLLLILIFFLKKHFTGSKKEKASSPSPPSPPSGKHIPGLQTGSDLVKTRKRYIFLLSETSVSILFKGLEGRNISSMVRVGFPTGQSSVIQRVQGKLRSKSIEHHLLLLLLKKSEFNIKRRKVMDRRGRFLC